MIIACRAGAWPMPAESTFAHVHFVDLIRAQLRAGERSLDGGGPELGRGDGGEDAQVGADRRASGGDEVDGRQCADDVLMVSIYNRARGDGCTGCPPVFFPPAHRRPPRMPTILETKRCRLRTWRHGRRPRGARLDERSGGLSLPRRPRRPFAPRARTPSERSPPASPVTGRRAGPCGRATAATTASSSVAPVSSSSTAAGPRFDPNVTYEMEVGYAFARDRWGQGSRERGRLRAGFDWGICASERAAPDRRRLPGGQPRQPSGAREGWP